MIVKSGQTSDFKTKVKLFLIFYNSILVIRTNPAIELQS